MAAIEGFLTKGHVRTPDLGGVNSTSEMCHAIRETLLRSKMSKGKEVSD
jgi:isocitrate/isopropylmalate dehydrogenase